MFLGADCCCLQNHVIRFHPSESVPVTSDGKKMKVYTCKECSKPFPSPSVLTAHMRRHTGEKPFECGVVGCGQRFATAAHMRVSEEWSVWECGVELTVAVCRVM